MLSFEQIMSVGIEAPGSLVGNPPPRRGLPRVTTRPRPTGRAGADSAPSAGNRESRWRKVYRRELRR